MQNRTAARSKLIMRPQFSLRTTSMLVAIAASFTAFVRSWFAGWLSILDLVPLVFAVALVTVFFLARATKRGRTSVLGLMGTGAAAAFSMTSLFVVGAAIVWSACVYADDTKGFLVSPWAIVVYVLAISGSIAAVTGAIAGLIFSIGAKFCGSTDGNPDSPTPNHGMHSEASVAGLDNCRLSTHPHQHDPESAK